MMERTLRLAKHHGVAVGAHPGYPDQENFGRVEMALSLEEIEATVDEQIRALAAWRKRWACSCACEAARRALQRRGPRTNPSPAPSRAAWRRWSAAVILVGLAGP